MSLPQQNTAPTLVMAHVVNRFNARDAEALALKLLDEVSLASAETCVGATVNAIKRSAIRLEKKL